MRPVITVLVSLAAAIVVVLSGSNPPPAQAALIGCFGAPADYIAAFDTAGGQSQNGQVEYPQPRFYVEEQTWATHALETPGHHSEHQHVAACIPNAQTMTGTYRLDMAYTLHNMQDYAIQSASMSAVSQTGSRSLWQASAAQVAQLQAAADASCPTCANNVQKVFFSVTTDAPTNNGLKEIRGGLATVKSGPEAVFLQWNTDVRTYETDNFAGLPASTPIPSQRAIRVRPLINFPKQGDPSTIQTDYHHSGWCGMDGNYGSGTVTGSYTWTRTNVSKVWPDAADKRVCLYVTDGGGPAMLMIDPQFHTHCTTPPPGHTCDAAGNDLGVWQWQPPNARKELFGNVQQEVIIPASVIASLSPGVHRLVFKSDDFPECVRTANFANWDNCPPDVRGSWTNVSVLPFKVN